MPQDFPGTGAVREAGIARPRLDALFDEAFQRPLVVVNAGAGFGKTTAVCRYLDERDYRIVWFTFAMPDNIPARFWEHLIRVFAQHRPTLGARMEKLGFPESQLAFGSFLAALSEELYQDDLVVAFVFDDLHLVSDAAVQGFLANLIASRLENSTIVLVTRQWPVWERVPPVVPRVIGPEDLRFSPEETAAFLAQAGLADTEAAARIHHYVSGWPIALSLVGLGISRGEAGLFDEAAFSGAKPALFSLFEREIFSQYTPAEQDLLIKVSVLDSFPRGLVQAVTGEKRRELGSLLTGNAFIHYDADTLRLSFHPLYQEFLREKLRGMKKDELDDTYKKAARWCRDNGYYYDAVNYYRQCGQYDELWDTLQRIPAARHTKSEAEFFIEQIGRLPEAFRHEHPMTCIVLATILANNLRTDEAQAVLEEVEGRLLPQRPETRQLLGEYYIAQGFLILVREENGFEKCFKKAAELLPEGSSRWGPSLRLVELGPGLNLRSAKAGELKKSLACFTEGVPYMAQVLHGAGRGLDALCQCEALFLTGELKSAVEPAYQALYAAEAAAQYDIVGNALFMLLRIYGLQGDYARILDTLEHVNRYEAARESQDLGIWDITRGWFYSEMDMVEKVAVWIRNPVQKGFAPISIDRALLVRLRCLIAAGQYVEAMALVEQFEALAKGKGAVISLLYVALARAVTHNYLGNAGEAMAALKEVYGLARGNRLYTPIIEYGNRTRTLLDHARQSGVAGIPQDWLDDMYAKASTFAKRNAYLAGRYRQEQQGHLTDFALSRRETELLANLSQGLTREEIADSMELSLNTVKSMTKQVFSKLGAVNGADAVRIAILNQLI